MRARIFQARHNVEDLVEGAAKGQIHYTVKWGVHWYMQREVYDPVHLQVKGHITDQLWPG